MSTLTKRKKRAPRWIRLPVEPTPELLSAMQRATFLSDGSELEMHRRYNGLLEELRKRKAP